MIHVAVVAHVSRQPRAESLADSLGAELFLDRLTPGATFGHLNALNWGASKDGHLLVLEDDAEPVEGFLALAAEWINRYPDQLISFYLGTSYPPQYQGKIADALAQADRESRDYIDSLPTFIHAVAYSLPCQRIPTLRLNTRKAADYGLGHAWTTTTGRRPIYTVPSLVDHADMQSIENTGRRQHPRKAWRVHGHQEHHPA